MREREKSKDGNWSPRNVIIRSEQKLDSGGNVLWLF